MPIQTVQGDLLSSTSQYIVQQTCCTALNAHGLSDVIAQKWPHINPYTSRKRLFRNWATIDTRDSPGTIKVYENENAPHVICAFGQYTHGKPGKYEDPAKQSVIDDATARLLYFKQCLDQISALKPTSVSFPFRIGCGLAGGNWTLYSAALSEWSNANPDIAVTIYKL
jgi:O-acetyl-ADP-ribose deacetylase (regulator of RNase III)